MCDPARVKELDSDLKDALAKHAGRPWRGSKGDEMVSVRFDAIMSEGFDLDRVRAEVLEAGGTVNDRDAPPAPSEGLRRTRPIAANSFVIPAEVLQAG